MLTMKSENTVEHFPTTLISKEDLEAALAMAPDFVDDPDCPYDPNNDAEIDDAPVVRFLQKMLVDAINMRASDLHFEPYESTYRVRFRVDGELREIAQPPIAIKDKLASRIKVISKLDISEKRVPQDGRMKLKFGNKAIDFRVSTLPTPMFLGVMVIAWTFDLLLRLGSRRLSTSGTLDLEGRATNQIARPGTNALTVTWSVQMDGSDQVTGTVTDNSSWTAALRCCRRAISRVMREFSSSTALKRVMSARTQAPAWCCTMCRSRHICSSSSALQRGWVSPAQKAPATSPLLTAARHRAATVAVSLAARKRARRDGRRL